MTKRSVKMSQPQRLALLSARDDGSATAHLFGRSAWGGWTSTRRSLLRQGWIDNKDRITPTGFRALEAELSELKKMRASAAP
jgi:hypothetical protein